MKGSALVALAAAMVWLLSVFGSAPAMAQYKFETPTGQQTIGPSQMPQQPMIGQQSPSSRYFHVGNLTFPMGIQPSRQQGPQYAVPPLERAALAVWLLFIAGIAILVAVELQWRWDETSEFREGKLIRQDFRDKNLHQGRSAEL